MGEKLVYGPLELPSGIKIKFREPVGSDRVNVVNMLKMGYDNIGSGSMLVDGYVAAKCIKEIDGEEIHRNYRDVYDNMKDGDVSFYQVVFNEMFNINEEKRDKAKEIAKNLLSGLTSTATSN